MTGRRPHLLAACAALAACATAAPLRLGAEVAGYEVAARLDLDGDGRDDAILQNPRDCGSAGCAHAVWLSAPAGHVALSLRARLCEAAPVRTRGVRDVRCVIDVQDEVRMVRLRAAVRHRWTGARYESELAHLDTPMAAAGCTSMQASAPATLWALPARDVAVSVITGSGWSFGPSATPHVGTLEAGERFEPGGARTDANGARWIAVPGRGWVEADNVTCG